MCGAAPARERRRSRRLVVVVGRRAAAQKGSGMLDRVADALVGPDDDGERLDSFVASMPGCPSRSACARLIEEGHVTITPRPRSPRANAWRWAIACRSSFRARVRGARRAESRHRARHPLRDDRLIVLSKQAGLVCHPSPGHVEDSPRQRPRGRLRLRPPWACSGGGPSRHRASPRHGHVRTHGPAPKDDEVQRALQGLIRLRALDAATWCSSTVRGSRDGQHHDGSIARSSRDRLCA